MNKVLIWNKNFPLKNCGGPAGYLFNIYTYLQDNPCEQIVFLSDLLNSKKENISNNKVCRLSSFKERLKKSKIGKFIQDFRVLKSYYGRRDDIPRGIDFNMFNVIHFHVIYDAIRYGWLLKGFAGTIVVTSHMPEPPVVELSYSYNYIGPIMRFFKDYLIKYELKKIKCLKPIWMFPARDAIEPYIEGSNVYNAYFSDDETKIQYVPTCILDNKVTKTLDFFSQYNIPSDAFVICYIGRHNHVKGYDVLKEIGKELLDIMPNAYIVVAGKEEPLKRLEHERWIELGWISNAPEIIANSSVFVLPNDQTYFDIVFLEVLRSGTTLLASHTGGNKYFANSLNKDETKGIFFFNRGDSRSAVNLLVSVAGKTDKLGLENRKLWEKYFTLDNYIRNYLDMINKL